MTLRIYCPSCAAEIRNDSGICPTCGLTLNQSLEDDATRRLESHKPDAQKQIKPPSRKETPRAPEE